jgi:plastocyanin
MKAALAMLITCGGLLLAPGCGSSTRSPGASTGGAATTATVTSGSLKVSTTPKFASPPASAPVQSGVVQIAYRNITIAPDTAKVKAGSTIVWMNHDPVEHNVTSVGGPVHFASQNFGGGKSFRVTVRKPGVIRYLCTVHPATMNGTIEVVG